jgi:uncharacterized membrane protein YkoI
MNNNQNNTQNNTLQRLLKPLLLTVAVAAAGAAQAGDVRPDQVVELANSGAIKPFAELTKIAQALHPQAQIADSELEESYGRYHYQVELREGVQEWDVTVDAASGEVLRDKQDRDD